MEASGDLANLSSDCDFNLYTRFNVDGCDLLDDLRGRVQVDDALVNPHLWKKEGNDYLPFPGIMAKQLVIL